ncbi:MAG: hypothetical protein WD225_12280 [Ilumatobacteraceae bacterium]
MSDGRIDPGAVTITIGPRRFGGTRDVATAAAFAVGLAVTVAVAVRAGLPGVIGTVYVLTAFAAWVQGFRRSWRVGADQLEARRWFRWRTVERADVAAIEAARDEMGVRCVSINGRGAGAGSPIEIDVDDVRLEPLLAEALARFVDDCGAVGATVDPVVPTIVRP